MSAEKFRVKFPIALRLFISYAIIIAGMLIFLWIFNNAVGPRIYLNSRKDNLKNAYYEIESDLEKDSYQSRTSEEIDSALEKITGKYDVSAIVVDNEWNVIYVNTRGERYLKGRLIASVLGNNATDGPVEPVEILEEGRDYVFQKLEGASNSEDSYELWGVSDSEYIILCRFTAASIENSIHVMNYIIQIAALIALGGALIASVIMARFITKPIKDLTILSRRMSELDFDVKYEGKDRSEIGLLGETMNELSGELEKSLAKFKNANIALENDIKLKEDYQQRQKEFISDLSHELKTPIALISGYAEALKEGIAKDPESINEYCEIIIDESDKMDKFIKQMLAMSEFESGHLELIIERFDIVELLSAILNANIIYFEKKGIKVEFEKQNEKIEVWADKMSIEQVITNYITNAINHCSGQNVIRIDIDKMDKTVRVHVWNSGENIPESQIGNIWDKFFKVDKARTREYGGNGVGLSIVKSILDMHGTGCGVKNTEDGVDFWFDLDCDKEI